MDTYLTITEASQIAHQPEMILRQLARVGIIKSIMTTSGEILVNESDMRGLIAQSFHELDGKPISIGDASRKYKIPHPTLSRWKGKYIKILYTEGQRVFLDEGDVARQAQIYASNPGQGRWTVRKLNSSEK